MATRPAAGFLAHLVAARAQTLEDAAVSGLAAVAVIAGDASRDGLVEALSHGALEAGFAVGVASLAEHGLHELDVVVSALAASLRTPGPVGRRKGLVAALDAFAQAHGRHAEARFAERAEVEGLFGELATLARGYLAGASGRSEARRLHAWLAGRDITAPSAEDLALRPLSARTAKRAFAQLSRLLRVLGHRGCRFMLTDAEALVDLARGRRDVAYGVLRELIDNADGFGGMVASELLILGSSALERRVHSLGDHQALGSRITPPSEPSDGPPVPHQSWVSVPSGGDLFVHAMAVPEPRVVDARRARSLRALLRAAQGLPPVEAVPELTVGMEGVEKRIAQLFAHAAHDGSVFAVLCGEYGAGKTHHVLYLEARALAERRPVFRLAVERLDEDLGNPQRHLRRMLDGAIVPGKRPASALERLDAWLASPRLRRRLRAVLDEAAAGDGEGARAAERAIGGAPRGELDDPTVSETLGAIDLVDKPSHATYRKDAYGRLHLWLDLLAALEGCEGPVVILDEAENLYRVGVSRAERRTALRSLGFYAGGSLPRACVVLAVTPDSLAAMRDEAGALLDEIEEQATLLPVEDVSLLRRRLLRARPIQVSRLDRDALFELAEQARRLGREVRGPRSDPEWGPFSKRALAEARTPRELLRRVVERQERLAWLGSDAR